MKQINLDKGLQLPNTPSLTTHPTHPPYAPDMTQLAPAPPATWRSNANSAASRNYHALTTTTTADGGHAMVLHRYQLEGAFVPKAIALLREETTARKEIREVEHSAFEDLKIAVSLLLSEIRRIREMNHPKNFRARAAVLHGSALTRVVENKTPLHERDVWFPTESPRGVPSPPRPIQKAVPAKPFAWMLEVEREEEELREWITRLESKLRQPIERGCVDSWLLLTGPQRLSYDEEDARREVVAFEERDWTVILKRFKHLTPVSHFITLIRNAQEAKLAELAANPIHGEELDRATIVHEEHQLRCDMFQWLFDMYGVRLYSTARVEVRERCDIEEEESDESAMVLLSGLCESDFRNSRFALTALHAALPHHTLLRDVFAATL